MPTVAPSLTNTIVFDFTRQAIVHASSTSRHSWAVGSRLEATFQSPRDSRTTSTSWINAPPGSVRTSQPAGWISGARTTRRFGRVANASRAPSVKAGAITTSVNTSRIASAAASSQTPWKATIPPKALTSSHANAPR